MRYFALITITIALTITFSLGVLIISARAQEVAPGWRATGEWQCYGGRVRIISSTDGRDGTDYYVQGAWFDNHFTWQRGTFYYNGTPCIPIGDPLNIRGRLKMFPSASKQTEEECFDYDKNPTPCDK